MFNMGNWMIYTPYVLKWVS